MHIKPKITGLIFDLDGTLIDSTCQIAEVMNHERISNGFPPANKSWYELNIGLPVNSLISDLRLSSIQQSQLISSFRNSLVKAMQFGVPVFKDTVDAIDIIVSLGFEVGIATSKPSSLASIAIQNSKLSGYDFLIQGTDGFPPKPNPEVIQRAMQQMRRTHFAYIGDRVEDVLAAKLAGLIAVGLSQGAHNTDELLLAGADAVFENLGEFAKALSHDYES